MSEHTQNIRAALEWYADKALLSEQERDISGSGISSLRQDGGRRAYNALDELDALDRLSGRVTVKALVWDAWDGGMTTARTPLGKFILAENGELTTPFSGGCKRFETPKAAKAAAQADFEARILAALDTAPAPLT